MPGRRSTRSRRRRRGGGGVEKKGASKRIDSGWLARSLRRQGVGAVVPRRCHTPSGVVKPTAWHDFERRFSRQLASPCKLCPCARCMYSELAHCAVIALGIKREVSQSETWQRRLVRSSQKRRPRNAATSPASERASERSVLIPTLLAASRMPLLVGSLETFYGSTVYSTHSVPWAYAA